MSLHEAHPPEDARRFRRVDAIERTNDRFADRIAERICAETLADRAEEHRIILVPQHEPLLGAEMAVDRRRRHKRRLGDVLNGDDVEAVRFKQPERRELHVSHRLEFFGPSQPTSLLDRSDSRFHMIVTITTGPSRKRWRRRVQGRTGKEPPMNQKAQTPTKRVTVLISGAGIAGPTLAFLLARAGFRPTLIERACGLRSSGTPVDVRDEAFTVALDMGVVPRLRQVATQASVLSLVDSRGRPRARARLPINGDGQIEVLRSDLARVLCDAASNDTEFLFDESIVGLRQDSGGVDVTFERAAPRRFDVVVGCDGVHSTVRRLAFGSERQHVEHLGLHVATLLLDGAAEKPDEVVLYNAPNRAIAIHPGTGKEVCALMYRAAVAKDFDHRDVAQHRRLLDGAFRGAGWRALELLKSLETLDDFYFDSVSRIRLDRWSTGRIALLGDAASCVSFLGGGSSNAIAGAAVLARALAATPDSPEAAFAQYEEEHRRLVEPKMGGVKLASRFLIPATRAGIMVRNLGVRAWSAFGRRPAAAGRIAGHGGERNGEGVRGTR